MAGGFDVSRAVGAGLGDRQRTWDFIAEFAAAWRRLLALGDGTAKMCGGRSGSAWARPPGGVARGLPAIGRRKDLTARQDPLLPPDRLRVDHTEAVIVFGASARLPPFTVDGLIWVASMVVLGRQPPAPTPVAVPEPGSAQPGWTSFPSLPETAAAQPIPLVVGIDNSKAAQRALSSATDLLRAAPVPLHVVYSDHLLIDSDLFG